MRKISQLCLKKRSCQNTIIGVGSIQTSVNCQVELIVESRHTNFKHKLNALVLQNITSDHPCSTVNTENWNIPKNILLADECFYNPARIDILIGSELFMNLLCVGQISIGPERPVLQKTVLGWVVSGKASGDNKGRSNYNCITTQVKTDESINNLLTKFWELEEFKSDSRQLTSEEESCEEHFRKYTRRNKEGRFIVRLPFKQNPESLGNSFESARRRLSSLERKFNSHPDFRVAYQSFMEEYMSLRHMEPLNMKVPLNKTYFMPHHGIMQTSGASKKLRVVFDASCKSDSGVSLNDILMVGPPCQSDLFSTLCRFRSHTYVLTADIIKMYRQILVDPEDASYQSILWIDDKNNEVKTFQLNTVTYGTASAPFLATRCVNQLGLEHAQTFPLGSNCIIRDLYVDDMLTGADSVEKLKEIKQQVEIILGTAGMSLHKWCSNLLEILQEIDQPHRQTLYIVDDCETTKTLGMITLAFTSIIAARESLQNASYSQ